MKITLVIFLFLIFGCEPRPETNPNALTEPLTVENKEVGWKIEVPAGWEISNDDKALESTERGLEIIDESINLEIDASTLINLMRISKNETNILAVTAEPFFEEFIGEWEWTNEYGCEILNATYQSMGFTPEISPIATEKIGGLKFVTYSIKLNKAGERIVIEQTIYSSLHNGFNITAAMTYTDNVFKDEMLLIWRSSIFDFRKMPDSIKTHYAEMDSVYDTYILNGDGGFAQKKYGVAKFWYQKANELNPLDEYPKQQLITSELFVDEVSKEEMANLEIAWQYKKIITRADEFFASGHLEDSYSFYQRACAFDPSDHYPVEKMAEVKKLIRLDYPEWTP